VEPSTGRYNMTMAKTLYLVDESESQHYILSDIC